MQASTSKLQDAIKSPEVILLPCAMLNSEASRAPSRFKDLHKDLHKTAGVEDASRSNSDLKGLSADPEDDLRKIPNEMPSTSDPDHPNAPMQGAFKLLVMVRWADAPQVMVKQAFDKFKSRGGWPLLPKQLQDQYGDKPEVQRYHR